VEFGESAAEALAREFLEETGRAVRVWNLRGAHDQVFVQKGKERHEVSLIYAVTMRGDTAVRSLEKGLAFEWASVPGLRRMDLRPRAHEAIIRAALKHSRDRA
jgi:ADP-ribose pyrophosphatase YjhB (NUDIX family)